MLLRALAPGWSTTSANIGSRPRGAGAQNARMDMNVTSATDSHTIDPADSFVDSRDFARMTRAIEFIEREFERQPRLAEIARHVGLSEFHFNRLFRRWTGLTPKQYLAEVTSRAAGDALARRTLGHGRRARCRTFGRRATA